MRMVIYSRERDDDDGENHREDYVFRYSAVTGGRLV